MSSTQDRPEALRCLPGMDAPLRGEEGGALDGLDGRHGHHGRNGHHV